MNRQRLDATCRHCGSSRVFIEQRMTTYPVGSFSMSDGQVRFSPIQRPHAVCDGCGHVSQGQPV